MVRVIILLMGGLMMLEATGEKLLGQESSPKGDWQSLFEPREYADEKGNVLNYRLMKPLDYKPSQKYPVVLFLHGAGERGNDNAAQLKHGMREFTAESRRREYPCYVIAPQCPTDKKWVEVDWSASSHQAPVEASVSLRLSIEVIRSMLESSGVDRTRIYITGLSMGGYGTWDAVARYPDLFAAAVPICGGGDPSSIEKMLKTPIWAFHGGKDKVVLPQRSREMIDGLKKAGAEPKYTEYPDAGHDSWTETYANPELYRWMFGQRRKQDLPTEP